MESAEQFGEQVQEDSVITQDRTPWTPERLQAAREAAYAAGVGTHLPLLAACIAKAGPGAVVEIGTGHASAPLVSEMCKATGRVWCVWDTDDYWRESARDLGEGLQPLPPIIRSDWAVAFVDCVGDKRLWAVEQLRDHAEFIVIHDTDNQGGDLNELLAYLDTFTYRYDYKVMRPWTTVVSMTRPYP